MQHTSIVTSICSNWCTEYQGTAASLLASAKSAASPRHRAIAGQSDLSSLLAVPEACCKELYRAGQTQGLVLTRSSLLHSMQRLQVAKF